jgi:phage-Barnase-EndoU-ColicinE5/D-RelE like nuclease3
MSNSTAMILETSVSHLFREVSGDSISVVREASPIIEINHIIDKREEGERRQELVQQIRKEPFLESRQSENKMNIERIEMERKIGDLHDRRLDTETLPHRLDLFIVPPQIVKLVFEATGIDLSGYMVRIHKYEIIHALKHSDPIEEANRGQIAIKREDIIRFLDIIFDPDEIKLSEKNTKHTKKPCIEFAKTIVNKTIVKLEIRTVTRKGKTNCLAFKTMWIKKIR